VHDTKAACKMMMKLTQGGEKGEESVLLRGILRSENKGMQQKKMQE